MEYLLLHKDVCRCSSNSQNVLNAIAMFFLVDDTPLECRHYYCSAAGDEERTEVYIVPRTDFEGWLAMEKCPEKLRKKLYKNQSEIEEK